ncbi:MAG: hypothetical protein WC307_02300 [Candidatus Nanoarchaeia archaeon]|jgi:hypothetical protein
MYFKEHQLFYLFLAVFTLFSLFNIDFTHLNSDEGSYALTAVFFNRLVGDWLANPTIDPSALFSYAKAYYVFYPKFMFLNGPLLNLINAPISFSPLLMKLVTLAFSIGTIIVLYHFVLLFFKKEPDAPQLALLSAVLTATSSVFFYSSITIMLDVPSIFFFVLALFLFFKNKPLLTGLCLGLSVLMKDVALPYVAIFCLLIIRDFRKQWKLFLMLGLSLLPYIILIAASGGLDIFAQYPAKQLWYVERQGDPQWYDLSGWLYYWQTIVANYSLVVLPFLFFGMYYAYKSGHGFIVLFILLSFLVVTLMSDKAERRVLNSVMFLSPLIALGAARFYNHIKSPNSRFLLLFIITLMLVVQLPLFNQHLSVPMAEVAIDLVNDCPDCTVLIASETGNAYSSFLMYESLIRDENVSLRFIRPAVFESMSALEVINSERVNRVVVIGDFDYLWANYDYPVYLPQINFIVNRYQLIKAYESDVVGHIFVFDTGITDHKALPLCVSSPSLGSSFCTDAKPSFA